MMSIPDTFLYAAAGAAFGLTFAGAGWAITALRYAAARKEIDFHLSRRRALFGHVVELSRQVSDLETKLAKFGPKPRDPVTGQWLATARGPTDPKPSRRIGVIQQQRKIGNEHHQCAGRGSDT